MEKKNEMTIFCRGDGNPSGAGQLSSKQKQKEDNSGAGGKIRCRSCGRVITSLREKTSIDGSHAHTFFNPAGIIFELGCFRQAPGCQLFGEASMEFTWFAGCSWRFALCGGCRAHLGWQYEGREMAFYGLILTKLRQ